MSKVAAMRRSSVPRLLTTILLAGSLLGCSPVAEPQGIWGKLWKIEVGPNYKRPENDHVEQFRSQIGPSEAASFADEPWWQAFNDKALQELIAEALAHNYDLAIAIARVDQARAQVWVAASPLYPQVGYQALAAREKVFTAPEIPNGNETINAFGALLNVAWELDIWGRVRRSTEAARAALLAQEEVRRGVMLTLVSDVATDYFTLVELDRELEIARQSSTTYHQTLDLFSQRFEFGQDSKLPVERAQAAYDSSIATMAALQRTIVQLENALSTLLGDSPREINRGLELTSQTTPATPVGLASDLLIRRPDILQGEQTMISANAEIGVAVANFFPRIGLTTLYGGESEHIDKVFDSSFGIWNIAANLTGPIFQGGALLNNYYAQQAFWDAAIAQYKQTILTALREVSDALIAQQTLVDQRASLEHEVKALQESVDLSLLRYTAGRASYFEVLEAEQLLFPAEDQLAQAQRDQLLAVVNLYRALGGGWNLNDAQWTKSQ